MRKIIAAALVAGVVATPATVMAHGPEKGQGEKPAKVAVTPAEQSKKKAKRVKKVPVVNMVFSAVVSENATADAVVLGSVDGVNRHAERVLGAASSLTLKIVSTKLKGTVIKADGTKSTAIETYADLKAGDRVFFVVRAKKNVALAELPAAKWLRDFTGTVSGVTVTPVDPTTPPPPPPPPPPPGGGDGGTVITPL